MITGSWCIIKFISVHKSVMNDVTVNTLDVYVHILYHFHAKVRCCLKTANVSYPTCANAPIKGSLLKILRGNW